LLWPHKVPYTRVRQRLRPGGAAVTYQRFERPRLLSRASRRARLIIVPLLFGAAFLDPADSQANQNPSGDQSAVESGTAPATPRFRTEANFVRVDVYAMREGVAVRDLKADEFEVFEEGARQSIDTFEHVEVRGWVPQEERRDPQSAAEGCAMAENPRSRVFVVFLDTYRTDVTGSHSMQNAIATMLDGLLSPEDVFAVMTPEMSARDLAFAKRTDTTAGLLRRYWTWGREGRYLPDAEEGAYESCYPEAKYPGVVKEMVARRREHRTLGALEDLAIYLRGVREERKAVIAITSGWLLFRPNPSLAEKLADQPVPGVQPLGVDPQGRISTKPHVVGEGSLYECDSDGPADAVEAELLDRNGKPMQVPLRSASRPDGDGHVTWASAELTLAPLAPGEYVIRTTIQRESRRQEVLMAFRMVP
jgi:hypothetical protein